MWIAIQASGGAETENLVTVLFCSRCQRFFVFPDIFDGLSVSNDYE